MNAPAQRIITPDRGHIFRSQLVEAIAQLELWTLRILQSRARATALEKPRKAPQFITQRIKRVRDLQTSDPKLVHSWPETLSLLEELEAFSKLRSDLVHAILTASIDANGDVYFTFESTRTGNAPGWERRRTFREAELRPIIDEARKLVERLSEQLTN